MTKKIAKFLGTLAIAVTTALAITALCSTEKARDEAVDLFASYASQGETAQERHIDWSALPKEVVAWVEVPGTNIDEPIVRATPDAPNAYLYRDVFEQGAYGTPYIDYECALDSRFVMVYGHHMSDGSVFADFANYIDEGYAREHNKIIIHKRNGDVLELEPCAVDVIDANIEGLILSQETDFGKIFQAADLKLSNSPAAEQLFAFTTCSYQTRNSRTTVFAMAS